MPFWSKKPSLDDQVIDLKMTARTIAQQQKMAEKQAKTYETKMKAEVKKGNQDTARLYADQCIQLRNSAKQFMILSCRVDAAAMRLQSMASMSTVSTQIAKSVSALKAVSATTDVASMFAAMDGFQKACEDSNVQMAGLNSAMGMMSVSSSENADSLLAQAQAEVANDGFAVGQAPVGGMSQTAQPIAPTQTDDILSRLNNL